MEDFIDGFWHPLTEAVRRLSRLAPTETYIPGRQPVCSTHSVILEHKEEGALFEYTEECLGPTDEPACAVARIVSFEGEPEWLADITVPGSYLIGIAVEEEYSGEYGQYNKIPIIVPLYPEELDLTIYPS
jgi:hypothetical protein